MNHVHLAVCIIGISGISSCTMFQVITAKDHDYTVQTEESIQKFTRKHKIDKYPVYCLADQALMDKTIFHAPRDYFTFDLDGNFIDTDLSAPNGCPADNAFSIVMSQVIENGDTSFYKDSISYISRSRNPDGEWDTSDLQTALNIDKCIPFLTDTRGGKAVINHAAYDVYYPFTTGGKSKFYGILIRELGEEISMLNARNEEQINLVLVCIDQFDRMLDGNTSRGTGQTGR